MFSFEGAMPPKKLTRSASGSQPTATNNPPDCLLHACGCSVLRVQTLLTALCREKKKKRCEAQMKFLLHTFLYKEEYAPLAQLVEQLTLNQWVLGSSPRWCTTSFFLRWKEKGSKKENTCAGERRKVFSCVKTKMWPVGQAVKTAASHAANGSSILPRVTKKVLTNYNRCVIVKKLLRAVLYGTFFRERER